MENQQYTEDFKQSIVNLCKSGKSSTVICKEYGMSSSTLHKWIKIYTQVKVSDTETLTMAEIKKMQKNLALLEEENLILKKSRPWHWGCGHILGHHERMTKKCIQRNRSK